MIRGGLIAVGLAFVCLVLASQVGAPTWVWALHGVAVAAAAAALFFVGGGLARLPLEGWLRGAPLPLVAAGLALGLRGSLLAWIAPPDTVPRIDYGRIQLGAGAAVAALFALVSGTALLARGAPALALLVGGLAVTAALFVLGPLLLRAGLPLDHRTFLGLAGLGASAFAAVEAGRRIRRRREGR